MITNLSKPIKTVLALGLAALVSGCASQGASDNPIVRKFSWLSYLEGSDIRSACRQGAPDQYRMVYNGIYTEQVRMYDLKADGSFRIQVLGEADLTKLSVSKPGDLLSPWKGRTQWLELEPDQVLRVAEALDKDGAFGPPAVGTELSSKGFFWTVAACHDGRYSFNAWMWPSPKWDELGFDDVLLDLDDTKIPFNPPRKTETQRAGIAGKPGAIHGGIENAFWTKVGENGLVGVSALKP